MSKFIGYLNSNGLRKNIWMYLDLDVTMPYSTRVTINDISSNAKIMNQRYFIEDVWYDCNYYDLDDDEKIIYGIEKRSGCFEVICRMFSCWGRRKFLMMTDKILGPNNV